MDIVPLIDYMQKFVELEPQEVEIIQKHTSLRNYLKGQFVVQQGDVCRHESFVVEGCLRTFYVDEKGQEHTVMFAIENWWTADLGSFLTQTPAHYNVQCLENTKVIQFSHTNLENLYLQVPKMERFFRIILQRAYVASERRLVRSYSLTAKERYLKFRQDYPLIEQRVPQYMIASYLGITKEFLSKIRNQLILEQ
ncbi:MULTISPECIES: Crp/Fnr family transcriptional regulator [Roseivirga]|jgi:CRP-like cAMP-binding protein|uniref:Cyclic nucleotide-binding protein n=1 Tax=Roseivirga thermotolerans TaxID=1758176 RepID=A0ABQ3I9J9_9BACT|nr:MULTISPECIES: Crp/Fnr family transcriptional regulator [Roseivirga]GHE63120.1 cyclic nucleotide-binding protein [Roseivirga thermotolerans]|tara:strand:- start:11290 stop:11874 length:585 start_codon:yes stop_codon:yes gene_type:complete